MNDWEMKLAEVDSLNKLKADRLAAVVSELEAPAPAGFRKVIYDPSDDPENCLWANVREHRPPMGGVASLELMLSDGEHLGAFVDMDSLNVMSIWYAGHEDDPMDPGEYPALYRYYEDAVSGVAKKLKGGA